MANPIETHFIAEARINTDERSPERSRRRLGAETLAPLLQSNSICKVWVPQERTRRFRQPLSHRIRLPAILHRHQIRSPTAIPSPVPEGPGCRESTCSKWKGR